MANVVCRIVLPGEAIECTLLQRWPCGARLFVGGAANLPDEFRLRLERGEERDVVVFWEAPAELGVRFKR